jgi:DNA-directed RNA polymerase subunit N
MKLPVRCFTCGAVIGKDWDKFLEKVEKGEDPEKVLDQLGYHRYCCRRMFLSHVELMPIITKYKRV